MKAHINDMNELKMFHNNYLYLLEKTNNTPYRIQKKRAEWSDKKIFWPCYATLNSAKNLFKKETTTWLPTSNTVEELVEVYNKVLELLKKKNILLGDGHTITKYEFLNVDLAVREQFAYQVGRIQIDARYTGDYNFYHYFGSNNIIYSGKFRLSSDETGQTTVSMVLKNLDANALEGLGAYLDPANTSPLTESDNRIDLFDGTATLTERNLTLLLTGRYIQTKSITIVFEISEFENSHYPEYLGGLGYALTSNVKGGCHIFKLAAARAKYFENRINPNNENDELRNYLVFDNTSHAFSLKKENDDIFFSNYLAPKKNSSSI